MRIRCKAKSNPACSYINMQSLDTCRDCIHLILKGKIDDEEELTDMIPEPIKLSNSLYGNIDRMKELKHNQHTFDGKDISHVAGEEVIIDLKPITNNTNKVRLDDIHQDSIQHYKDIKVANSLKEKPIPSHILNINDIDLDSLLPLEDMIEPEQAMRFNEGKPQWSLVHFNSLEPMVRVLEFGALKYAPRNWQKPMDTMKILESMQRHLAALFDGEEVDSESGISHMGHIQCNAMFYNYHKAREKNEYKSES